VFVGLPSRAEETPADAEVLGDPLSEPA